MLAKNKKNKSKAREYYILAGEPGVKEMLDDIDMELSPVYFMVIKDTSGLGILIKEEAKRRVNKIKNTKEFTKEDKE